MEIFFFFTSPGAIFLNREVWNHLFPGPLAIAQKSVKVLVSHHGDSL